MGLNRKNERLKSLKKKHEKAQKQLFTVVLLIIYSGNSGKFSKNVSAPETYDVTK